MRVIDNFGQKVIEVIENDTVAIVRKNRVELHQKDPLDYEKFERLILNKEEIIAFAEILKTL